MLIAAFGLRLELYSPKFVSEINQELDLKLETAKQQIRIVTTRRMGYSNIWYCTTKTVLCIKYCIAFITCLHASESENLGQKMA